MLCCIVSGRARAVKPTRQRCGQVYIIVSYYNILHKKDIIRFMQVISARTCVCAVLMRRGNELELELLPLDEEAEQKEAAATHVRFSTSVDEAEIFFFFNKPLVSKTINRAFLLSQLPNNS